MTASGVHDPSQGALTRGFALTIIALVLMLNHTDRLVLGILLEPIRREFDLSDAEIGLLTGPAFAIIYALLVIPIARLAERYNRIIIVAICLVVWSAATVACGLAGGLASLLLARMLVGAGEAGGLAPSMSVVSDLFSARARATAMGFFGLGASLAVIAAPVIGGILLSHLGWRGAFIALGIAGAPLALLLLFVAEPRRGQGDELISPAPATDAKTAIFRLFKRPSYSLLVCAFVFVGLAHFALLLWLPSVFERNFGVAGADLGARIGLYQGAPLLAGTIAGGFITDFLTKRDVRWLAWIPMLASIASTTMAALLFLAHNAELAFAILVVPSFVQGLSTAPSYTLMQNLAAVRSRATSTALLSFCITIVGAAFGPLLVGVLSDLLSPRFGQESLRYAFFAITPIYALSAAGFLAMSFFLKNDVEDARAESESAPAH
jgi:predicted MFS family arabinose efflux permease